MKILVGHISHETNTFCSGEMDFTRFCEAGWQEGGDVLPEAAKTPGVLSGMMAAAEHFGAELIPVCAVENSGPPLSESCVARLTESIRRAVEGLGGKLDGVCFSLHGAAANRLHPELDAYFIQAIRSFVGSVPIVVALDLHANISPELFELADALFCMKQYPHVDYADTGARAMNALLRRLNGELTLHSCLIKLPLLIPMSGACTTEMPMKAITDFTAEYLRQHGLLELTFVHGFPYADAPYTSASVLAVSGDALLAQKAARDIAPKAWELRDTFMPEILMPETAIRRAERALAASGSGFVVINEASDNPGSGAPGNGTHLLRALLSGERPKTVFGYIYDPIAAEKAHSAHVGDTIDIVIGAETDAMHGSTLTIRGARICALSDGEVLLTSPMVRGMSLSLGKTARLRKGNIDIIVASLYCQTVDDRPFHTVGADINDYRIIALKSANHFRAYFSSRALEIITTDPPGLQTADLKVFDYHRLPRPIYPLDDVPDIKTSCQAFQK